MSAFLQSGRSDLTKIAEMTGRFRPQADLQDAFTSDRITDMGWYRDTLYPKLTNYMGAGVDDMRGEFLSNARGIVVDVGPATAENLRFYDPSKVEHVYLIEPTESFQPYIEQNQAASSVNSEWLKVGAENMPLDSESIDTVVSMFTLCTIPDKPAALADIKRVLKPDGQFLFMEHGRTPHRLHRLLQVLEEPIHKKVFGGCSLSGHIESMLRDAGFEIDDGMEVGYPPPDAGLPWWMPDYWAYIWTGVARRPN